jgi:pimeloyl-ACP methyl ester carboxylesterase
MKLFFQKIGQEPSLIILHGLYGSSDNWITVARRLASRYTIYLVDLRNHGRSPHHPDHTYPLMATDIEELMASESIDKAYILGHSMGGKTAMLFAALHPERVSGLIIVDIAPGGYTNLSQYSPQVIAHLNIVNTMLSVDFSKLTSRAKIENDLAKTITDTDIRRFIMKNVQRNANNSFGWKLNIDAIHRALPGIMGPIPLEKIMGGQALKGFPILFIKGEYSDYITPDQIPMIRQYFPEAEIKTIPSAGHWVHAEQPKQFIKVLEEFLSN